MAYELKKTDEMLEKEKKAEEDRAKYGDAVMEPVRDLPEYRDMSAVKTAGAGMSGSGRKVIYMVVGLLVLAAAVFGIIKGVQYMLGSSGEDISDCLAMSESELASKLGVTFEQHDELAAKVQHYSGKTITVRACDALQVIYADGKQVGVATDSRDYRFFGIGINDPEVDLTELMTYKSDYAFVVLNDLMGGSSESMYYCDTVNNTCLVITVNKKSNRVVYMTYFTDMKTITKDLSF